MSQEIYLLVKTRIERVIKNSRFDFLLNDMYSPDYFKIVDNNSIDSEFFGSKELKCKIFLKFKK